MIRIRIQQIKDAAKNHGPSYERTVMGAATRIEPPYIFFTDEDYDKLHEEFIKDHNKTVVAIDSKIRKKRRKLMRVPTFTPDSKGLGSDLRYASKKLGIPPCRGCDDRAKGLDEIFPAKE